MLSGKRTILSSFFFFSFWFLNTPLVYRWTQHSSDRKAKQSVTPKIHTIKMTRRRWRLSIVLSSNVLLLLLTWCTTTKVVQSLLTSPRELERRLQKMSKEELEEICTERGFELIKDEIDSSTGQPVVSTHQDHVDAAWQCLQMWVKTLCKSVNSIAREEVVCVCVCVCVCMYSLFGERSLCVIWGCRIYTRSRAHASIHVLNPTIL